MVLPERNLFADCNDLQELIGQTIGAASMCWQNPSGAGIFDEKQAAWLTDQCLQRIKQISQEFLEELEAFRVASEKANLQFATNQDLLAELSHRQDGGHVALDYRPESE